MSSIEKLVPPRDLCQQILPGAFDESALVWLKQNEGNKYHPELWLVVERESTVEGEEIYPAPTLAEIMAQMAKFGVFGDIILDISESDEFGITVIFPVFASECDKNPATAALELWLELNERKEENA